MGCAGWLWLHVRHPDLFLAKDKAEDGEGAEEEDEDIRDKRDQAAGISICTLVIH